MIITNDGDGDGEDEDNILQKKKEKKLQSIKEIIDYLINQSIK